MPSDTFGEKVRSTWVELQNVFNVLSISKGNQLNLTKQ